MLRTTRLSFSINTLFLKHFQINKQDTHLVHCLTTPLIQLQRAPLRKQSITHTFRHKFDQYAPQKAVMIGSYNNVNALQSKMVNSYRNVVVSTIEKEGEEKSIYVVTLHPICKWVPEDEVRKHLMLGLDPHTRLDTKAHVTDNLLEIVRNPDKHNHSFRESLVDSSNKRSVRISMINYENTYRSLQYSAIYLLENCPDRTLLVQDAQLLIATLSKFNVLKFFVDLKSNDTKKAFLLCQRFIRRVDFKSSILQRFLLDSLKQHKLEKTIYTIQSIVWAYKTYYQS